jgi:hypothetical protein
MNKALIALAALTLPTEALAASWTKVGQSGKNTAWIDTSSIRKTDDVTGGWYRLNLEDGEYAIIFAAFKCNLHTYMDLKATYYDAGGENSNIDSALKGVWEIPVPDSIMDGVVNGMCGSEW